MQECCHLVSISDINAGHSEGLNKWSVSDNRVYPTIGRLHYTEHPLDCLRTLTVVLGSLFDLVILFNGVYDNIEVIIEERKMETPTSVNAHSHVR